MKKEFYIKNMVCDRCKMVVQQIAEGVQATTEELQLGKVVLNIPQNFDEKKFSKALQKNGFELMQHPEIQLTEAIKVELIHLIENNNSEENSSSYLANRLHKDYSLLSKTFKKILQ